LAKAVRGISQHVVADSTWFTMSLPSSLGSERDM